MKKLVLIGGGDIGRGNTSYETKEIDEEIVKLTGIAKPNLLFIGLASTFSDSYYDTIKKIYKELGCECAYLKKKNIINNPDIVKEKINKADIIYIGGGDTIKLLNDIKEYKIDELLVEAYNRGCVLAGTSAGAILLSNYGYSDSYILRGESNKYEFIKGLGLSNINFCPHYHSSKEKDNELESDLKEFKKPVYCLENCTALEILDNNVKTIKSKENAKVYKLNYEDQLQIIEIK